MAGKVKEFQKKIADDADFKETIQGDYVCEYDNVAQSVLHASQ